MSVPEPEVLHLPVKEPVDPKTAILEPGPDPLEEAPAAPAEPAAKEEPAEEPAAKDQPSGWQTVDYDRLPESEREVVKQRIDRLYGQVKTHEKERSEERKFYQKLEQKLDSFISDEQVKRTEDKVELLSARAKKQFEEGKHEDGIKTLRELARIERDTIAAQKETPAAKDEPAPVEISEEDSGRIHDFFVAHEKILPYDSPEQRQAIDFMRKQIREEGRSVEETLQITADLTKKLFGAKEPVKKKQHIAQQVLGQNHTIQKAVDDASSLSDEEKSVAVRFFSKLSPDDAYKKYAAGKNL